LWQSFEEASFRQEKGEIRSSSAPGNRIRNGGSVRQDLSASRQEMNQCELIRSGRLFPTAACFPLPLIPTAADSPLLLNCKKTAAGALDA